MKPPDLIGAGNPAAQPESPQEPLYDAIPPQQMARTTGNVIGTVEGIASDNSAFVSIAKVGLSHIAAHRIRNHPSVTQRIFGGSVNIN